MRTLAHQTPERLLANHERRIAFLERRPPPDDVVLHIKVTRDNHPLAAAVEVRDALFVFACSRDMHELELVACEAYLTTAGSGGPTLVQLRNITQGNTDMLSTRLTIDAGALHDNAAAVIAEANALVNWKDQIAVDVDACPFTAYGLGAMLTFRSVA